MARGSRGKQLTLAQVLGGFLDKRLIPDLRARVEASPSVQRSLADALARERAAGRSADDPIAHRERTLEQIGAAWILSAVFVRFLEDRGLVEQRRLAGPGAVDAQERFGAAFPALAGNAREYLLAVFRECARLPGAREVLGPKNNLALRLGPSVAVAAELLHLLREEDAAGALVWRFDSDDTRALGDLYQDLSDAVKDRYALLQTPDFVEAFILERTLDPAVKTFKLAGLRVIDPTCGSGHFLLGACARLRELHTREEPSADPKRIAREALRHVFGVDLNPFAVAISRFRLLVDFVRAAGITRLREAPDDLALDEHIVVADSLLYGGKTLELAESLSSNAARRAFGEQFVLEDLSAARAVFGQKYHAVVGNPPYIVCRDAALRESYRTKFPDSAQRQFALGVPFTERFFELAEDGGFVGLINSNSFTKREFGRGLIERVLPQVDLTSVVDTSGAYISGHDTPTVILFGRNQRPVSEEIRVVMGRRGEPGHPEDPAKGQVWSSISTHDHDAGFENEFITVTWLPRATLSKHPWSLGGGGASDLKKCIEEKFKKTLDDVAEEIGFAAISGEDNLFLLENGSAQRNGVGRSHRRPLGSGEVVRDWTCSHDTEIIWPCNDQGERLAPSEISDILKFFWPCRTSLKDRKAFSVPVELKGIPWWAIREVYRDRFKTPLTIAFAFIATHNHFVLDRGGKVFNRSAPIIKLPSTATEDYHLALLAWLNSSAACFWMKQVSYPKGTTNKDVNLDRDDPATNRYEFAATGLLALPVPLLSSTEDPRPAALLDICKSMEQHASVRANVAPSCVLPRWSGGTATDLKVALDAARREGNRAFRAMVVLQEEIDWLCYSMLGLCDAITIVRGEASPTDRPFEWSDDAAPASLDPSIAAEWTRRRALIAQSDSLRLLESSMFKRPWEGRRGVFGHGALTWDEQVLEACKTYLLDQAEAVARRESEPQKVSDIARALIREPKTQAVLEFVTPTLGDDPATVLAELMERESLPFLAPMRFTDAGLEKRALWERTWALQRREDAGERVGEIPVPPKYDQKDYREARYWSLRGKLDVPRERFIAYPGATTDDAPSPLYGWAGWDHKQRADALTTLYLRRKNDDGWTGERLVPLLAGLAELLPWLKQWHNTPEGGEDQGAGDAYAHFVAAEARELGMTTEQLAAWRVPDKREAKAAARAKATKAAATSDESGDAPAKKRGRPKKTAAPDEG